MMSTEEFAHILKQTAAQGQPNFPPFVYGHIALYDPNLHRIQAIIPSMRDDDGSPVVSPWMPLQTVAVGPGYGMQVIPFGGSTIEDPTAGEQVLIGLMGNRGVCAALGTFYNNSQLPPATAASLISNPMKAGETIIFNKSGTYWRLHANGDAETNTQGKALVTAVGDVDVVTQGAVNATAGTTATVTAATAAYVVAPVINLTKSLSDTLHGLLTSIFKTWADGHVHSNGNAGGNTGAPTTTAGLGSVTTVVQGE